MLICNVLWKNKYICFKCLPSIFVILGIRFSTRSLHSRLFQTSGGVPKVLRTIKGRVNITIFVSLIHELQRWNTKFTGKVQNFVFDRTLGNIIWISVLLEKMDFSFRSCVNYWHNEQSCWRGIQANIITLATRSIKYDFILCRLCLIRGREECGAMLTFDDKKGGGG